MNNKSFRTLSALAVAIATASSGAHAAQLEEIIVTAQKRAESLQDVPISMVAIEAKKSKMRAFTALAACQNLYLTLEFQKMRLTALFLCVELALEPINLLNNL